MERAHERHVALIRKGLDDEAEAVAVVLVAVAEARVGLLEEAVAIGVLAAVRVAF